ncbi:MAG TPA: hypothetical protein VGN52_14255 [Burkholderiales bacterium]
MSVDDLLVVGFGVFVGYWVVANLLLGPRKPAPPREEVTRDSAARQAQPVQEWQQQQAPQLEQPRQPDHVLPPQQASPPQPWRQEQRQEGDTPAWHEVLQVAPQASVEEIRRAYQARLAQCETGGLGWLGGKFRDKAAAQAVKVKAAYRQALREKGLA